MESIPSRPVVLTGYDLEVQCPYCNALQFCSDDGRRSHAIAGDELLTLHAFPGRYLLMYRLHCWGCAEYFSGRVTIRSRAAWPSPQGMGAR
jgi:hypothetical protein